MRIRERIEKKIWPFTIALCVATILLLSHALNRSSEFQETLTIDNLNLFQENIILRHKIEEEHNINMSLTELVRQMFPQKKAGPQ